MKIDWQIYKKEAGGDPGGKVAPVGDTGILRAEILYWVFSIASALLVYLVVAVIVSVVYRPDIAALNEQANRLLLIPSLAIPEPMEALLFRLGIVIILPCLWLFYYLFAKMKWVGRLVEKPAFNIISVGMVVAIGALIFFDFMAANPPGGSGRRIPAMDSEVNNTNFNFFFDGFFLGNYWWLYFPFVVPIVTALFFIGIKKYRREQNKRFRILSGTAGYLVIGSVIVALVAMNTFYYPYSNDNKYDFNAVYYSMTQVYAGVPMLADGFTNTYGLYPHFLNPLFQLTGMNVLKFSLVMSLMLACSFCLNFYTLRKFVSNRVILFLGFATMLFFSYLNRKLTTQFDCYFALFPIRYVVPAVLLSLAGRYFFRPSQQLYWITTILMAFSVLWNPEIGIVCYLSWIAVNIYRELFDAAGKINLKKTGYHLVIGITVLIATFYTYKLLILLFYGAVPDLGLLWKTMFIFSNTGFMCLPMSIINPWNLFALVLVLGFFYAISRLHKRVVTPKSSIVFLLSLIGLGYLMYYQGRSHNVTLLSSTGFCILLLTVLGDELWQLVKSRNELALNGLFVLFLAVVSFSGVELVYNSGRMYKSIIQEEDKQVAKEEKEFVESNTDYLLKNTAEKEKIFLITVSKFQGLYFNGYKRRSGFNPGIIDMLLSADHERMQNTIRDSSFNVFIEPILFYYPYLQTTTAEIAALYDYKSSNKSMAMLTKRTKRIPAETFFNDSAASVFHRKYTDDSTGIKWRMNDAFGIQPVVLAPEFSVSVLFNSQPQICPFAVLTGNTNEPKGFAICNEFNSANYLFIVNGSGLKVQLPYNHWIYCVMNVYTDHKDVFVNGVLAGTDTMSKPIIRSDENLCIGNLGSGHYYVGAIAEVAINNKIMSPEEIQETFRQIITGLKK